jgi:hypothetical protein
MATATGSAVGDGLEVGGDVFDVRRHDATVTLTSPRTGEHRTFRIRTVRSGDLEGKRVVELLSGPDNGSDYRAFAFVSIQGPQVGRIFVWNRYKGADGERSLYERYADLLARPEFWSAKGVAYLAALRCRRCGRPLTHPESIGSGVGPVCAGRDD